MQEKHRQNLQSLFAQVEDPCLGQSKLYRLRDSIILATCGGLCGAEGCKLTLSLIEKGSTKQ